MAARVLSDFFKEIIIIERDKEPEGPFPRKGALQGEHLHALLHAGQYGLEELFPGISEKCCLGGAVNINSTKDLAWFHHGVWKLRFDGGYTTTLQTRPHLEWYIEEYIKRIPNVTFLYNKSVRNYLYNVEENRLYGVEIKNIDGSIDTLAADLIIDASGAGSLTTNWLKKAGRNIPNETVKIGLSYFSKAFSLSENETRNWKIKVVYPNPPHEKIGGTISRVEGERYIVTLMGYQNVIQEKEVLKNDNGFLELTKKLPKLDIYNEIKAGIPLSKTSIYRVPQMVWNRFDKVQKLPDGLLLIGDTVCRIDPVFGQGMSIAILESLALQKLFQNKKYSLQKITTIFHKKVSKILAPIWNMVITEVYRYPEISGNKSLGLPLQQWYAKNIFLLSSQNKEIYNSFINVMNLVRPTAILLHPRIIKKVLAKALFNK